MSTPKELKTEYDALLFAVLRSIRYHRHRERFFERVHHLAALTTAIAGAATVATLVADLAPSWTWLRIAAASLTAAGSATELVLGAARGAREHSQLAARFIGIEKELRRARPGLNAEALEELQSQRLQLEAAGPPVYRVLEAICHNELITALGRNRAELRTVTTWQRQWRHLLDVGPERLRQQAGQQNNCA